MAWQHGAHLRVHLGEAPAHHAPPATHATHATPHPPRTLCVLKSRLGARGVMEGATATAALSAAGLFV